VGTSGPAILATTDGGATWRTQKTNISPITDLFFADARSGWASSFGGIYATTDGGRSWKLQTRDAATQIVFVNARDGWAVGERLLLTTTDGGGSWKVTQTANAFVSISFVNANDGWAVGDGRRGSVIRSTTDGGRTWHVEETPRDGKGYVTELTKIDFSDSWHGWALGFKTTGRKWAPVVLATTDGGTTWREQTVPGGVTALSDVAFANADDGWAIAFDPKNKTGVILATTDGGANWTVQYRDPTVRDFGAVTVPDARHVWVTGSLDSDLSSVAMLAMTTTGGRP